MSLARAIQGARRKKGLNQSQLARLVGVTRQAVSDWEKGIDPTLANLRKVARVTQTPLAELVGG